MLCEYDVCYFDCVCDEGVCLVVCVIVGVDVGVNVGVVGFVVCGGGVVG